MVIRGRWLSGEVFWGIKKKTTTALQQNISKKCSFLDHSRIYLYFREKILVKWIGSVDDGEVITISCFFSRILQKSKNKKKHYYSSVDVFFFWSFVDPFFISRENFLIKCKMGPWMTDTCSRVHVLIRASIQK